MVAVWRLCDAAAPDEGDGAARKSPPGVDETDDGEEEADVDDVA